MKGARFVESPADKAKVVDRDSGARGEAGRMEDNRGCGTARGKRVVNLELSEEERSKRALDRRARHFQARLVVWPNLDHKP